MRLLLIILGAFAVFVSIEKPAEAQNGAWCIYKPDTPPQCRYATLEQCLADRLGKGGSCGPSLPILAAITSVNEAPEALNAEKGKSWQRSQN